MLAGCTRKPLRCFYKAALTRVNVVFDPVPTELVAVRQTTAMSASISEYSTIVEPSSLRNILRTPASNLAMTTSPFETRGTTCDSGAFYMPTPTDFPFLPIAAAVPLAN